MQNTPKMTRKEHCNKCSCVTNHYVESSFRQTHYHPECDELYTDEVCYIVSCCGCKTTSFVCISTWSEEPSEPQHEIYPPRTLRKEPRWTSRLGSAHKKLLREVYIALGNDCLSLAAMGIRSIVDAYITEKVGDCGTFTKGMDALLANGHITQKMKEILEIVVDCGNAAIHRQFNPEPEAITLLLDTVELLLHQDIIGPKVNAIKAEIPPRPAKKKKA